MKPIAFGILAALTALPAIAQTPKDLIGDWAASCDAWGTDARCTLEWAEGLHPDHLTITYNISSASDGGEIFTGQGVYRISETGLEGYWADSGGAIHPLSASWDGGTLVTHWGRAGHDQGRSRYTLTETGLRVTDWALTETGWQQFMQADYTRAD